MLYPKCGGGGRDAVAVVGSWASGYPRYFLVALYWAMVGGGVPSPRDGMGVAPPNGASSALLAAPGALPPLADTSVGLVN